MKLDKKLMISLLKEEYDKRINFYLGEVETKAKHSKRDGELIEDASGLKVKDRAGNVFVIEKLDQNEQGEILVYLIPPGESDPGIKVQKADAQMNDDFKSDLQNAPEEDYLTSSVSENEAETSEKENKKLKKSSDIREPNPKAKNKKNKNFKINVDSKDVSAYDEVEGRVVITLKELDRDFTL